jgi:hypothetical protein
MIIASTKNMINKPRKYKAPSPKVDLKMFKDLIKVVLIKF